MKQTVFSGILDEDKKSLHGSFRLMCLEIIRTVDHGPNAMYRSNDDEIVDHALKILSENKILVTIDNFEDIEEPDSQNMSKEQVKRVTSLYNSFAKFFESFRTVYANGSKSRMLITTRGRGAKLTPYRVPELNSDETYNLFRRKIEVRTKHESLDARIFTRVSEMEDEIKESFSLWTLTNMDSEDGKNRIEKVMLIQC